MKTVILIYNGDEILTYKTNQIPLWTDTVTVDESEYIVMRRIFSTKQSDTVKLVVEPYNENEE
jgi:hypothetical protein